LLLAIKLSRYWP